MNLFKAGLTSIIRKLLVLLFAWLMVPLINHQWLTSDLGKQVESSIDNWAGAIAVTLIGLLAPVVWGVWDKVIAKVKIVLAAHVKSGEVTVAPESAQLAVQKTASELSVPEKWRIATSPGLTAVPAIDPNSNIV